LAVMSYDQYLAICCPLQYNTRMTTQTVTMLIAVTWLFPFLAIVVLISLTSPLQLCGNIIHKVYCGNFSVVKLSCSDTTVNNVYGLIYTFISIILPLVLILYTYVRILKVCFSGSKQTRQKAVSTCTPHLASLLNFSFGCSFEIVQSRFNMNSLHNIISFIICLSLYFLTCLLLFTPVLYGLNMNKICTLCQSLFSGKEDGTLAAQGQRTRALVDGPEAGQEPSKGAPQKGGPKTGQGQRARARTSAPDVGETPEPDSGQGLEQRLELAPRRPPKPEPKWRLPGPSCAGQGLERGLEQRLDLALQRPPKPEPEWRLPGPSGAGQGLEWGLEQGLDLDLAPRRPP
ncbi:olfactory receptor 8J1-like, partial [Pleuronectes platessa]|uniref:olfactory receptor 8J1-like n=1 Tax=Pleuronectes platessa TaxID=8262 RepID=UPI00232A34B2